MSKRKKMDEVPRIILEEALPIGSLKDLIKLGNSVKFYKNIDCILLWRILPNLIELDSMIGMESLKTTVFYQVVYYLQNMNNRSGNSEYLHTIIMGSPGTGKTSVAKIIGKLYQVMGILSPDGVFKVAYRADFIAGYLGQTAIKTTNLLNSCIGGILFIDEVYSLGPKPDSNSDSFSKEALDTLTAFLSEHKDDFCCIAAGYKDDIDKCFFAGNKGLERRFPWVHTIDKYNPLELNQILHKMASEQRWDIVASDEECLSILTDNKDMFMNAGGDIETFLGKCKMTHARRVFTMPKEDRFKIIKEDMDSAIEMIKEGKKPLKSEPPMSMYI